MAEQQTDQVRTTPTSFPSRGPTSEVRRVEGAVLTAAGIDRRLRDMRAWPQAMDRQDAILARMIGAEIARRREEKGSSQTELAAEIGCDRSSVSRWEAGLRLPSLSHLAALGRVLGCGVCALLPTE